MKRLRRSPKAQCDVGGALCIFVYLSFCVFFFPFFASFSAHVLCYVMSCCIMRLDTSVLFPYAL
jgi:hypothetical protein